MAKNSPEEVLEQITAARITLLLREPFWGTLATRLILKDATDDEWCPTAATDGRYFYYNRNFLSKLSKQETMFLVAHEVNHCIYDHMDRRGSRKPKMWNAAADYVINYELVEHRIGELPSPKSCGVEPCYDVKFKDMFTEQVYEELMKDPKAKCTEFDVHLEPGDGKGEPMTDEERAILGNEIQAAVMQAAKNVGADKLPSGVRRMLHDLTEPQMDWREILQMQIKSMMRDDYTWTRCSRKSQASGIYLPALKEAFKIEAVVAIDTSGSMSDEMLKDLLGEVKGIMEMFPDFKLHVLCYDTAVHNPQLFTPENLEEINSYDLQGGGGTIFQVVWDYLKREEIVPERLIMFTDGADSGDSGKCNENYCETVFVIHSDPNHRMDPGFGMVTYYE